MLHCIGSALQDDEGLQFGRGPNQERDGTLLSGERTRACAPMPLWVQVAPQSVQQEFVESLAWRDSAPCTAS